ncbi:tetratricopeptide repeat protein [Marinihelvus fidelis]|uniref:Tetratricopeptide repeat protein n=1 Tax=Marinihelvus fidelis TaxID=2613842 RepID=A0A5N0THC5_9GAMM|nr:tetratricopeptide repeat protein [Marinihelvus fidelis]KAA9133537.1 tetratricopeptide repeat protein [Marinihelvus fidelis]
MGEQRLAFADCIIDPGTRELRRDGRVMALQSRVFDLLYYLASHRDRVVGKDELMDAVWPGRVITETALTRAVMKARKAIGDDATEQAMIGTVHGHGYRFVADVAELTTGEPTESTTSTTAHASTAAGSTRSGFRFLLPLALLAAVALAIAFWAPWQTPPPDDEIRLAVLPLAVPEDDPDMAWVRLGLMGYVSGQLDESGGIVSVNEADVLKLAEVENWTGALDEAAMAPLLASLGRLQGMTHAVALALEPSGTGWRLNYLLVSSGRTFQRGTMVGSEPMALARGAVQAIHGELLGRSRMGQESPLVSDDAFHNEAHARGLGLAMEGRCAEAERYFRMIIEADPDLFAPRYELASCLRVLGQSEEAEPLLKALESEQRAADAPAHLARVLRVKGVLYEQQGRLTEAETALQESLALAAELDDHTLAGNDLVSLAIVAQDRNDWDEAAALLDRAVVAYTRDGRKIMPGYIYSARANLAMDQGRLAEADEHLAEAVSAFREAGDRRNEAMMLNNLGFLRRNQGRLEEAETLHRESLAIREAIGDRVGVGRIYGMLAVLNNTRGDAESALEVATRAREISSETGDRLFEATALAHIGDAQRTLGDTAAARAAYVQAREILLDIDDGMRAGQVALRLAWIDLDEGHPDAALAAAESTLVTARQNDLSQLELDAMELVADVRLAQGARDVAIQAYEDTLLRAREAGWSGKANALAAKLADLYLDNGDTDQAAPLVGALASGEDSLQSLRVQARYAIMTDDPDIARSLYQRARSQAGKAWTTAAETEWQAQVNSIPR